MGYGFAMGDGEELKTKRHIYIGNLTARLQWHVRHMELQACHLKKHNNSPDDNSPDDLVML